MDTFAIYEKPFELGNYDFKNFPLFKKSITVSYPKFKICLLKSNNTFEKIGKCTVTLLKCI